MESVGRTWFIRITQGPVRAVAELGTYHVATGLQTWQAAVVDGLPAALTEDMVLEELWQASLLLMEQRTSLG